MQSVRDYDLAAGMSDDDVEVLRGLLTHRRFGRGEYLVREGDMADAIFLIARGVVGVWTGQHLAEARRVASFSAGTVVGEIGFIDGGRRSATLVAEDDVERSVLEREDIERLESVRPAMVASMMRNIAVSLAVKLRRANEHLDVLSTRRT